MEIQLRLDGNGRTTYDPASIINENPSKEPKNFDVNYDTKSIKTNFYEHDNNDKSSMLDDILLDCEVNHYNIFLKIFIDKNLIYSADC